MRTLSSRNLQCPFDDVNDVIQLCSFVLCILLRKHSFQPHSNSDWTNNFFSRFFSNEVMRVPLYEAVPVELVISNCWVMDLNTFCKGRPIGAPEEHIYICEYRVDKGAKMFSKVSKSKFPVCTKTFAFERFESRLKMSRTYCPHDVDESLTKTGRKQKMDEFQPIANAVSNSNISNTNNNVREVVNTVPVMPLVIRVSFSQTNFLVRYFQEDAGFSKILREKNS